MNKSIFVLFISIFLVACESMNFLNILSLLLTAYTSLNVYLYNTEKRESGWNNSFATANALRVLKDQVQVAGGNAIVIRDIYSSKEYRDGYNLDAAGVYIDVYKCPENRIRE